jgi:predicted Zn-dependent peptidase
MPERATKTADVNGISHMLEHMAVQGHARRRSTLAIAEDRSTMSAVNMNAYTSREITTAYFAKVLKENLPLAVDILSDILLNCYHGRRDELAREQSCGGAGNLPGRRYARRASSSITTRPRAYPNQPMGWPMLGKDTDACVRSRPSV